MVLTNCTGDDDERTVVGSFVMTSLYASEMAVTAVLCCTCQWGPLWSTGQGCATHCSVNYPSYDATNHSALKLLLHHAGPYVCICSKLYIGHSVHM